MKRREFFEKTIKAGGLFAISSIYPSFLIDIDKINSNENKLGIALVGLGKYSTGQLAPALMETSFCYLAGIVTGSDEKAVEWSKKYNIPEKNIYNYENFDQIANNKSIEIVYVVLPNSMHAEFTIRAAEAGKHVISEKPMATSVTDCEKMINACKKAGKKLSIGYRLHFEPHHLKMMELGQRKVHGKLKTISGGFGGMIKDPTEWRLNKKMAGGGPLMDLGIYALQGCTYTSGELPRTITAKFATKNKDFFKEVEGSIDWEMEYSSGLKAVCRTSYEEMYNYLKADAEKGVFELSPAFSYGGIKGRSPQGQFDLPRVNQQARQMDDFSKCILENKESVVPGEMGLRDVYLMEKIYEAAESGKSIEVKNVPEVLHKI